MSNEFEVVDRLVDTTNTSLRVLVKDLKIEPLNENGVWLKGKIAGKQTYKHITLTTLKLLLVSNQIL